MVNVTLFRNCPFNNSSVMSKFDNYNSQNSYFENYPTIYKQTFLDVLFDGLDKPILLEKIFDALLEFTYGYIEVNSSRRRIYFSISDFKFETYEKTWMYFEVDWWETLRYPVINGYNHLSLARARIYRTNVPIANILRPFPYTIINKGYLHTPLPIKHTVFISYHERDTNLNWIYYIRTDDKVVLMNFIKDNDYCQILGINPSDIISMWYESINFELPSDPSTYLPNYSGPSNIGVNRLKLFDFNFSTIRKIFSTNYISFINSPLRQLCLEDRLGNIFWTSKLGRNYVLQPTGKFEFTYFLSFSMTSATIIFEFPYFTSDDAIDYEKSYYELRTLDHFSDGYKDYVLTQKPFIAEQRRIQRNQALINGLASSGTSAIGGAVAGSLTSPGPGTVVGAIAGGLSSILGSSVNYLTSGKFDKQLTVNEDNQNLFTTDAVITEGNAFSGENFTIGFLEPRQDEIEKYFSEINSFGYFCDNEIEDLDDFIKKNDVYLLSCDAEVENVPKIAEITIKNRLRSGVKFINPSG